MLPSSKQFKKKNGFQINVREACEMLPRSFGKTVGFKFSNQLETSMVFQLIGRPDITASSAPWKNAGLLEPLNSRNVELGLFENSYGY